jgi:NAD(P)-dependent dehydrogenase (short-subunit alcohol dehydrogenase family)
VANAIDAAGGTAEGATCDVTDRGQVDALAAVAVDRLGRVGILVNNELALRQGLDADHLGDRLGLRPADDDPSALNDARWIGGLVEEGPRQPGLVLRVEVERQVDVHDQLLSRT